MYLDIVSTNFIQIMITGGYERGIILDHDVYTENLPNVYTNIAHTCIYVHVYRVSSFI